MLLVTSIAVFMGIEVGVARWVGKGRHIQLKWDCRNHWWEDGGNENLEEFVYEMKVIGVTMVGMNRNKNPFYCHGHYIDFVFHGVIKSLILRIEELRRQDRKKPSSPSLCLDRYKQWKTV